MGGEIVAPQGVAEETDQRVPVLAGTFAIYESPDRGLVLVTDIPGRGVETRVVPGKLIKLATSARGAALFGRFFGTGED